MFKINSGPNRIFRSWRNITEIKINWILPVEATVSVYHVAWLEVEALAPWPILSFFKKRFFIKFNLASFTPNKALRNSFFPFAWPDVVEVAVPIILTQILMTMFLHIMRIQGSKRGQLYSKPFEWPFSCIDSDLVTWVYYLVY